LCQKKKLKSDIFQKFSAIYIRDGSTISLPDEFKEIWKGVGGDASSKKGRTANAESLLLAAWNIVITNASAEKLSISDCFLLYSLRWQIELLFKLWKSYAKVGHS
jgi:IS4 transposase